MLPVPNLLLPARGAPLPGAALAGKPTAASQAPAAGAAASDPASNFLGKLAEALTPADAPTQQNEPPTLATPTLIASPPAPTTATATAIAELAASVHSLASDPAPDVATARPARRDRASVAVQAAKTHSLTGGPTSPELPLPLPGSGPGLVVPPPAGSPGLLEPGTGGGPSASTAEPAPLSRSGRQPSNPRSSIALPADDGTDATGLPLAPDLHVSTPPIGHEPSPELPAGIAAQPSQAAPTALPAAKPPAASDRASARLDAATSLAAPPESTERLAPAITAAAAQAPTPKPLDPAQASHPPPNAEALLAWVQPSAPKVSSQAPLAAGSPSAPSPSAQVAAAIAEPVRIILTAPAGPGAAAQTVTVQLTPAELGRVEIRVARSPEGAARVELSAERPETLQRLMQDQSQLHQALDQAGIPSSDRTLHFSLSASAGSSTGGSLDASFTAGSGLGGQGQGAQGQAQNHGAGLARQQGSESIPSDWMQDDIAVPPVLITRTGLDITA